MQDISEKYSRWKIGSIFSQTKASNSSFLGYYYSDVFLVKAIRIQWNHVNYMWSRIGEAKAVHVYLYFWLAFSTILIRRCNLTFLKPQNPVWILYTALCLVQHIFSVLSSDNVAFSFFFSTPQDNIFRMEDSHFENGRGKSPYDPKLLTASLLVGRCHDTSSMRCAFTVNNCQFSAFFLLAAPMIGLCFLHFISRQKSF